MKKSVKAYLIIGTVMVITGLTTLAAAAGIAGGSLRDLKDTYREWYWDYGLSRIMDIREGTYYSSESATTEIMFTEDYDYSDSSYTYSQDFNSVDLNMEFGNITIEAGDEFNIEWDSRGSTIVYEINNDGILSITQEVDNRGIDFQKHTEVKITLPGDQSYNMISISNNAGNIKMEDLNVDELIIESLAGNIKLKDITTVSTFMDITAGNIEFEGDILEFANVDLTAGNAKFTLYGSLREYDYDLRALAGNITVDGKKQNTQMVGGDYSYNNGTGRNIEIFSSAGNIKLEFND